MAKSEKHHDAGTPDVRTEIKGAGGAHGGRVLPGDVWEARETLPPGFTPRRLEPKRYAIRAVGTMDELGEPPRNWGGGTAIARFTNGGHDSIAWILGSGDWTLVERASPLGVGG